jgi:hypothetical protein
MLFGLGLYRGDILKALDNIVGSIDYKIYIPWVANIARSRIDEVNRLLTTKV